MLRAFEKVNCSLTIIRKENFWKNLPFLVDNRYFFYFYHRSMLTTSISTFIYIATLRQNYHVCWNWIHFHLLIQVKAKSQIMMEVGDILYVAITVHWHAKSIKERSPGFSLMCSELPRIVVLESVSHYVVAKPLTEHDQVHCHVFIPFNLFRLRFPTARWRIRIVC